MSEEEKKFLRNAPPLTEKEKREINGLFPGIIFRRRKTKEVWTSCCNRHRVLDEGKPEESIVLNFPHVPEPITSMYWSKPKNEYECGKRTKCPFCGAEVKVKELGSSGNRKNLYSFHRAVVLRQWKGELWAMAYDCVKSYYGERIETDRLTELPKISLLGVYRFRRGKAECMTSHYWYPQEFGEIRTVTMQGKGRWMLSSPFTLCKEYGMGYDVLGLEEAEKSEFRYCGIRELTESGCDLLRLLTLCCFYPSQVEFLVKCGLKEGVIDYTERGVKNAAAIHWDAADRKDFLGASPSVLREIGEHGGIEVLKIWRKLSGKGDIARMEEFVQDTDDTSRRTILAKARKYGVPLEKIIGYMSRELEANKKKYASLYTVGQEYKDYLIAAEGIGLDLRNPVFFMPKNLPKKHDAATDAWAAAQAAKRDQAEWQSYQKRYNDLVERYEFTYKGMCIVIPKGSGDIVLEGKKLHHCVGGYADRHIHGKTTILFLRREEKKNTPLVTVEICGTTVQQAHGYDDERTACPENPKRIRPMTLYREFFGAWLDWVKAGSKRNKDGSPRLPKKYQEVKTA